MSGIFLSHSHKDKDFVRKLAFDLRKAGAKVWFDEAELKVGDSLIEKISEGLEEMEYVGAVISESAINSKWVNQELRVALTDEMKLGRVKVLPFLVEDCDLPPFLKDKLYADFREPSNYTEEFEKVCDRLNLNSLPYRKDPNALFSLLTRSLQKNEEEVFKKSLSYMLRLPYPSNVANMTNVLGVIASSIEAKHVSDYFSELTAIEIIKAMTQKEEIGLAAVKALENFGRYFKICPNHIIECITSSSQTERISSAIGMQGYPGNQVPMKDAAEIIFDETRAIHLRVASILIIGGLTHIDAESYLRKFAENIGAFPEILQNAVIDAFHRYPWELDRFSEEIRRMISNIEITSVKERARIYLK